MSELAPYPLTTFYELAGVSLPGIYAVSSDEIPQPHRQLLVHENDMTPTLEAHVGEPIVLHVYRRLMSGHHLLRQVMLSSRSGRRILFGAIDIDLEPFAEQERARILACDTPLGTILNEARFIHRSEPQSYFRCDADDIIRSALDLSGEPRLFGRTNLLLNGGSHPFVRVVEILSPECG